MQVMHSKRKYVRERQVELLLDVALCYSRKGH